MQTVALAVSAWVLVSVGLTAVYAGVRVAGDPNISRRVRVMLPVAGTAGMVAGIGLVVAAFG